MLLRKMISMKMGAREPIPGDDCEAIVDDVGDEIVDDNEDHGVAVREVIVEDQAFSNYFGADIASNDNEENYDSGDDIWDDDTIRRYNTGSSIIRR
ncbi:unnamed protein product [Microthlaspi erraticum]|nr:unnamed protein product [Microthlaspi erraticum]